MCPYKWLILFYRKNSTLCVSCMFVLCFNRSCNLCKKNQIDITNTKTIICTRFYGVFNSYMCIYCWFSFVIRNFCGKCEFNCLKPGVLDVFLQRATRFVNTSWNSLGKRVLQWWEWRTIGIICNFHFISEFHYNFTNEINYSITHCSMRNLHLFSQKNSW